MEQSLTKSVTVFCVITTVVVSFSFFVWVFPSFFYSNTLAKETTAQPLTPLQVAGRDVYIEEGCHVCHTQMVRNLEPERLRYGRPNKMEDDIYEFTFLWGSSRIGPDLTNVGLKYTPAWHSMHLKSPQSLIPESIMPPYPWLFTQYLNAEDVTQHMKTLQRLGVPYTDKDFNTVSKTVTNKTKGDALIAYLMSLGVDTHQEGDLQ